MLNGGNDIKDRCHSILVEEYATSKTDEYSQLHEPEFGCRSAYQNIVIAEEPDSFLKTKQEDPLALIKNDPRLKTKIGSIVYSVKEQFKDCTDHHKMFENNICLPVAKTQTNSDRFSR